MTEPPSATQVDVAETRLTNLAHAMITACEPLWIGHTASEIVLAAVVMATAVRLSVEAANRGLDAKETP